MNILWIAQKDLIKDLDSSSWLETSRSMCRQGHRVTLVTLSTSKQNVKSNTKGLKIIELPVINQFPFVAVTFHLQVFLYSIYWLLRKKEHIVLTHPITALFLIPGKFVCKITGRKTRFVLDIRTLPVRSKGISGKFKKQLHMLSFFIGKTLFDGITVITPALRDFIALEFGLQNVEMGVWMSGVDIELFDPDQFDAEHGESKNGRFRIMYHGAIADNRGVIETVKAMKIVNSLIPSVELFILGRGNGVNEIRSLIKELKISNVILHDPVSHNRIPDFIAKADTGIVPLPNLWCWRVSSPLKLFEYLAMARPVIVSPIEAHTNVLRDNKACFYLNSTEPEDIAKAIMRVYESKANIKNLGQIGRQFVTNNFTWDHQAHNLTKYLNHISLK